MQNFENGCCECPPMSVSNLQNSECDEKFYQEISTEIIGNSLIIRVEKDGSKKLKKMRKNWDPPCDCEDMVEIRRPKRGEDSAKIVNGGDNNQVIFKVFSKTRISKDQSNHKPQAIAYKVGACNRGLSSNDQCRTITVHPQMGGPGSQQVHSDHITDGNEDIFLLKINKKPDTLDPKLRNIELELRTPKPPTPELIPEKKEPMIKVVENIAKAVEDKKAAKKKGKKAKGGKK